MHIQVLACDYDGTLAHDGHVTPSTVAALERFLATGRKLVLVTGRQLDELSAIFPEIRLFVGVVAENGALLYYPATKVEKLLADAPTAAFVQALRDRKVAPFGIGRVIVASWKPNEIAILEAIRDLGLDLQLIFNKDAVMVLPAGVNKASGLRAMLVALGLSLDETVGVGDAENDLAFLHICGCAVAVANALSAVQEGADLVTKAGHGQGVEELIDMVIASDLKDVHRKSRQVFPPLTSPR
ncbi:MAG TPA: HAD family hydrolase [Gemmataceae bacterium]|nr:HAD family hydrolase [Gemmataceae bacterium]